MNSTVVVSFFFHTRVLLMAFCLHSCTPEVEEDDALNKLPRDEVSKRLGTPDDTALIKLYKGVGLYEYQSGLDAWTLGLTEHDTLIVTEMTWHLRDHATQKVWLYKTERGTYQSLDNVRWTKNVKF